MWPLGLVSLVFRRSRGGLKAQRALKSDTPLQSGGGVHEGFMVSAGRRSSVLEGASAIPSATQTSNTSPALSHALLLPSGAVAQKGGHLLVSLPCRLASAGPGDFWTSLSGHAWFAWSAVLLS